MLIWSSGGSAGCGNRVEGGRDPEEDGGGSGRARCLRPRSQVSFRFLFTHLSTQRLTAAHIQRSHTCNVAQCPMPILMPNSPDQMLNAVLTLDCLTTVCVLKGPALVIPAGTHRPSSTPQPLKEFFLLESIRCSTHGTRSLNCTSSLAPGRRRQHDMIESVQQIRQNSGKSRCSHDMRESASRS